MLYNFFCIGVIAIFSVLVGIFVNAIFNDFGIIIAILFYASCFFVDYYSTVRIRNFAKYEVNPLFCIFAKKIGATTSFVVIFAAAILFNVISWCIIEDAIFSYILGICHVCTAANNFHVAKRLPAKEIS